MSGCSVTVSVLEPHESTASKGKFPLHIITKSAESLELQKRNIDGTRNFYFKSWGKRKKLRNLVTPTRNLCPLGAPSYEILSPKALFGISPMGKSKKPELPLILSKVLT